MKAFIDVFLHIDIHLAALTLQYGAATYGLLFLVVFCETGLVVTPILPGDSLLFAAGALSGIGGLNIVLTVLLMAVAAVAGDAVNYWIGRKVGGRIVERGTLLGIPVKKAHVDRTRGFFDRYGARTLVLARFMPIIRTFAPFVAGVAGMRYGTFAAYNVVGGALWVSIFTLGGYFFGNIPAVRHNFTLVIVAIIVISLIPPVVEFLRARREARQGGK
jgi:membrane-associated protein